MTEPQTCLPPELQNPATTITPSSAGLSGAGVFRVDAAGKVFVLKITSPDVPVEDWRRALRVMQLASDAGLAPSVVHSDGPRRAILTDFINDRSFPALYGDPRTRGTALAMFGGMLRRVHELPIPDGSAAADPWSILAESWSALQSSEPPSFVEYAVMRAPGAAADDGARGGESQRCEPDESRVRR